MRDVSVCFLFLPRDSIGGPFEWMKLIRWLGRLIFHTIAIIS